MDKPSKSHHPDMVDCLCKTKITAKDFLAHTKQCIHCKATFGTLPDAIDNAIKGAKDSTAHKFLYFLFGHARAICKERFNSAAKVVVPPPIPGPIPAPAPFLEYPFPIMGSNNSGTGGANPDEPMEDFKDDAKKREEDRFSMMIDQSSVYCKLCSTRFVDLKEICYLQKCLHAFCRTDLKKLAFM